MENRARNIRPAVLAVALALATTLPAATAHAGVLVNSASAADCGTQVLEQPFKRWLDYFRYTLVPGGDFESGSPAWSLSGAKLVAGNEPFYVRSTPDRQSLSLGRSGVAQTRPVCVGIDHIVLRLFARNRGLPTSALTVEVLFEDTLGLVKSLPIGTVVTGPGWQPTLPIPVVANLLPLLPGEKTAIAFRFRAVGIGGDWQIDDVYVDPHRRS